MTFRIHAIPAAAVSAARSDPATERLVAEGGEPARCCLRPAVAGETLLLFGYEPVLPDSPYREMGAVIAHADECGGPTSTTGYPEQWRGRAQVLRAYDARGWIHDATTVHDGSEPERVITDILAHPEVAEIHSRNVAYGCWMFAVTRAG